MQAVSAGDKCGALAVVRELNPQVPPGQVSNYAERAAHR